VLLLAAVALLITPVVAAGTVVGAGVPATGAAAVVVHVQRSPQVARNVHVSFRAPALPEHGYYYAVVVLRPHGPYTRASRPRCSTSSDMQRTDYGYPNSSGEVLLALTPARSRTGHWCRGGTYEGAIYAVPHAPPCEGAYPCGAEPYEPPSPCWDVEGQRVVCGLVIRKTNPWSYPEGLPTPLARGTRIVARFGVRFAEPATRATRDSRVAIP
jgi:hypothetical protein